MKIEKYKYLGNGKYQVIIDNDKYIIYEDVIIKYNILSKDNISLDELNSYMKDNGFYECYFDSLKYIKSRLRTSKELKKLLVKKGYDSFTIDNVIFKLKGEGYLDEFFYTKSYIYDQINLKMTGPIKIKNDLISLGIDKNIIDDCLSVYTKEIEISKISKYINKEIRLNNKSFYNFKQKVLLFLINKGFTRSYIDEVINSVSFDDSSIREKEYYKLYNKLSKKYSGSELEYKIKEKMYQKGFFS